MNTILLTIFMMFPPVVDSTKVDVPVHDDFLIENYLGVWYECARFDHKFERGLDFVYIKYDKKADREIIRLSNMGYNVEDKKWRRLEGKAKIGDKPNALRVSFIPLVWDVLEVLYFDKDYKYAIVTNGTTNYLWIMSRYKVIPSDVMNNLLAIAQKAGYDTSKLIYIKQNNPPKQEDE